jgi:prepilin-type N-terminal cleavage/methylation domain-containing protein
MMTMTPYHFFYRCIQLKNRIGLAIGMKSGKGFTLIETMIAVTILTLSISGPLLGASRAIVLAEISRDQLTASYLAQEAIEYVRAMRDDAYLNSYKNGGADISTAAWSDFISGTSVWSITPCISSTCTLDPARAMGFGSTLALAAYTGGTPLYISNGIYTQQQIGTRTAFTRTIRATTVSSTEESITATVSWSFHNTLYTVTVIDHLTPWQ